MRPAGREAGSTLHQYSNSVFASAFYFFKIGVEKSNFCTISASEDLKRVGGTERLIEKPVRQAPRK